MELMDVLIVSRQFDPPVDFVLVALERLGEHVVRLNSEDFAEHSTTRLALGGSGWSGGSTITASGRVIDLDHVKSVWWRRPQRFIAPNALDEQQRRFAEVELDHAFHGMLAGLSCYWMSHPNALRAGRLKMEQLQRARSFGLEVPRTIVTTDPGTVRAFWQECRGMVVYKTLSTPTLAAENLSSFSVEVLPRTTMTTRLTGAHLEKLDGVRTVPCLFQEYIPKRTEFRVTVVGETLIAIEIDSQSDPTAMDDWRRGVRTPLRVARLPDDVAERCLSFVRSYNLNYSAMDLILTPDGRYVFLENNPNGQFQWLDEALPEARLVASIATHLSRASN